MGVYLSFSAARSVPDLAHDNCFISNAPRHSGIHSSHLRILMDAVAMYAKDLAAPAWQRNAFSMAVPSNKLTHDHFFDPSAVLADLERMQAVVLEHAEDLPAMHWLRLANKAGAKCLGAVSSSVNVYHEGEPSYVFGGWNKVELRPGYPTDSNRPPIEYTSASSFPSKLRSTNPIELDGLDVIISIERETFGSVIAPEFEGAMSICRWARSNACKVIPVWS